MECLAVLMLGGLFSLVQSSHPIYHDYIVIGAGPSGLQFGFFLERAGRDYVIFERSNVSGNFFTVYPRHDKLISINKRHTGKTNKEFNLRHDWNSLLSDDESLRFRHYSREFFPHREVMLKYLDDYTKKLHLNVQYNTNISQVEKVYNDSLQDEVFHMQDQQGNLYACKTLILATGMWLPNTPKFPGSEFVEEYETVSINPDDFEGQTVLILGRGNAAFEVADSIYGYTNLVHMLARSRIRLSWATHYVGDIRAVNNALLDTYQLKSLDASLEAPVEMLKLVRLADGKFYVRLLSDNDTNSTLPEPGSIDDYDNFALRDGYHRVIRCLGFNFDDSVFSNSSSISRGLGRKKKFPTIHHNYESVDYKNMFLAGTATHSLDFRKSAGGFIHGFRYTVRSTHNLLEWRNHQVAWPSKRYKVTDLLNVILKRINEASGIYQMFGVLGDVIAIRNNGEEFEVFEEFPLKMLAEFNNVTGHQVESVIVLSLEYGADFSGPGNDVFRPSRATGEPSEAHTSNFLHPVFYYYKQLPSQLQMDGLNQREILPRPDRVHHIVEDFLTSWDGANSHVLPLRRFLEHCLDSDLRNFFSEDCLLYSLTSQRAPLTCRHHFLQGQGMMSAQELMSQAIGELRLQV